MPFGVVTTMLSTPVLWMRVYRSVVHTCPLGVSMSSCNVTAVLSSSVLWMPINYAGISRYHHNAVHVCPVNAGMSRCYHNDVNVCPLNAGMSHYYHHAVHVCSVNAGMSRYHHIAMFGKP